MTLPKVGYSVWVLLVYCCFYFNPVQAQDTSPNIITSDAWEGVVYGVDPNNCCSALAGSTPLYDIPSDTIKFSYSSRTVFQEKLISDIIAQATGLEVIGWKLTLDYWLYDSNNQLNVDVYTNSGVEGSYNLSGVLPERWTNFHTENYYVQGSTDISKLGISITGKDSRFWAGYYGPEVKNVDLRFMYNVDACKSDPLSSTECPSYAQAFFDQQCTANPLYDSTCPNYATVNKSPEIVTDATTDYWDFSRTYDIATALQQSGSGLTLYGLDYSYEYKIKGDYKDYGTCVKKTLGICTSWATVNPNVTGGVIVRDANGAVIGQAEQYFDTGTNGNWKTFADRVLTLGTSMTGTTVTFDYDVNGSQVTGDTGVKNLSAEALFGGDPCTANQLYDTSCPGYEQAWLELQCASDPLYDTSCPGYAEAFAINLQSMMQEDTTTTGGSSTGDVVVNTTGEPTLDEIINENVDVTEEDTTSTVDAITESVNADPVETVADSMESTTTTEATPQDTVATVGIDPVAAEVLAKDEPSSDPQEKELAAANEMDMSKMSPKEIVGALSKLGILGNAANNGTGDPTGLGRDTVDGVNKVEGLTAGKDTNGTSSATSGGQPLGGSLEVVGGAVNPDGSVNVEIMVNGNVYELTVQVEESQNPTVTGGDPQKDLNSIFGGAYELADNPGLESIKQEQEGSHKTMASKLIKDRLKKVDLLSTQVASVEPESAVIERPQEDYGATDELSTESVSQSEVMQQIGLNEDFDYANQPSLAEVTFYNNEEIYREKLPENRRGLRNGLAQQILHEKMVEMQYNK